MDINTLVTTINAYIHRNGRQEITGDILNGVLLLMAEYSKDPDGNITKLLEAIKGLSPNTIRYDIDQALSGDQRKRARQNILAISKDDAQALVDVEKQRAEAKERELQEAIDREAEERAQSIMEVSNDLSAEQGRATNAEEGLANDILTETTRAEGKESELSARIDAIVQGRDVRDIVANYQALLDYDTTTLGDQDIIMVLLDNTKSDHTTYYRWLANSQTWEFIGGLAFTYTKTEIDQKFADLHIVLPLFNEHSSQELLAQVDETIRKAGADAQFKLPIPVEGMSGNVTVTYVKYNPANTYLGVFADDRSELYHITRTTTLPRTYTCEVITKVFASADALASLIKDLYNADPAEGEEKGDIVKINEALEGKANTDLDNITEAGKEVIKGLGGIPDAPADGKTYGRNGLEKKWVEMQGGEKPWKHIRTITIPADATTDTSGVTWLLGSDNVIMGFAFDTDENGEAFSGEEMYIQGYQGTGSSPAIGTPGYLYTCPSMSPTQQLKNACIWYRVATWAHAWSLKISNIANKSQWRISVNNQYASVKTIYGAEGSVKFNLRERYDWSAFYFGIDGSTTGIPVGYVYDIYIR